jgi:hypothetical protein
LTGVIRISPLIVVAAAGAACVVSASAVGPRVSQATIGGARLGLTAADYARVLSEKPTVTRYSDGTSRLSFSRAEISVLLGPGGRGRLIATAAPKYVLPGGIGPCGSLTRLARAYRNLVAHQIVQPMGRGPVVYQLGHLWFTTIVGRIGRISLASGRPPLQSLVNDAQCGAGEEAGG